MDDIHDAFVHAVERRVGGDVQVGVSLSGGYDSRSLLAAINHKQHRVKTLTLDVPGGAIKQIAERVARHTNGLHNHRFVENSASFFAGWPQYVRDMVSLTNGMYYDEACVMMPTLDIYRDMGVQVLLLRACRRISQDARGLRAALQQARAGLPDTSTAPEPHAGATHRRLGRIGAGPLSCARAGPGDAGRRTGFVGQGLRRD